ncbi:unnamed protein product, partial [Prorocentrum cordatum]
QVAAQVAALAAQALGGCLRGGLGDGRGGGARAEWAVAMEEVRPPSPRSTWSLAMCCWCAARWAPARPGAARTARRPCGELTRGPRGRAPARAGGRRGHGPGVRRAGERAGRGPAGAAAGRGRAAAAALGQSPGVPAAPRAP